MSESGEGPGFVLRNEHVLLLVFMWMLLAPDALFTIDLRKMSFKFNAENLYGTILPQLSIVVLAWAAIVFMTTRREIPIDPYLAQPSDASGSNSREEATFNAIEGSVVSSANVAAYEEAARPPRPTDDDAASAPAPGPNATTPQNAKTAQNAAASNRNNRQSANIINTASTARGATGAQRE